MQCTQLKIEGSYLVNLVELRKVTLHARIQVDHDIAYNRDSVHSIHTLEVITIIP